MRDWQRDADMGAFDGREDFLKDEERRLPLRSTRRRQRIGRQMDLGDAGVVEIPAVSVRTSRKRHKPTKP